MSARPKKEPRPPIAVDPLRLSAPATRLLDRLQQARLCREYTQDDRVPRGVAYWLEPGGAKVDPDAAEELIRKARVHAAMDGLFQGDAQTWERAP